MPSNNNSATPTTTTAAILLAAGSSTRMQQEGRVDKLFIDLCGHPILYYSLKALSQTGQITHLLITYRDDSQLKQIKPLAESFPFPSITYVPGGATRQESVYKALHAIPQPTTYTLVHDSARPLLTPENITTLLENLKTHPSAVLAKKTTDTILQLDPTNNTATSLPRNQLYNIETPQAFHSDLLLTAYTHAHQNNLSLTDESSAIVHLNKPLNLVLNPTANPKLTTPADLPALTALIGS